jgi:hypothetical protein
MTYYQLSWSIEMALYKSDAYQLSYAQRKSLPRIGYQESQKLMKGKSDNTAIGDEIN